MATGGSGWATARSRTARMSSWASSSRSSQRRWSSPESSFAARSAQADEPVAMAGEDRVPLPSRLEPLRGVLADRFEQLEAGLAVGALVDADEALVGERHQPVDDVARPAPRPGP